jgi:carbon monoxide dehydrogenase subunit G
MLIEGSKVLAASRSEVWQALNDPAFLQRAIPGCRRCVQKADDQLDVALGASVGPIKAEFTVELQKLDVVEETSYVLKGEGRAGAVGSAVGNVKVELSDVDGGTLLRYAAQTDISGRVAQLGSRMIDGAARKFSEEFFANVARLLRPEVESTDSTRSPVRTIAPSAAPMASLELSQALSRLAWKLAIACAIGTFSGAWLASMMVH